MSDEPDRRRLVLEMLVFGLLFLLAGVAFVTWRVLREGPRVLDHAPHHVR